jgi:hypothetical protein
MDKAGNSASAQATGINIDLTAPSITAAATTSPNAAGWYKGDVTVAFLCADAGAGLDGACPISQTLTGEGVAVSSTAESVTDKAGNTATSNIVTVKIDRTAPGITWNAGPAGGGVYYFSFVPAAPTCTAVDLLSGPDGCSVTGYSSAIGSHTLTATARDLAGNVKTETRTYSVNYWTISGFYQPVDMGGVLNSARAGSTVPLKFEIFAGTELTSTSVVQAFYSQTSCSASAPTDDIEQYATGGTALCYDATAGQFIFNWQTPKSSGACYLVTLTTSDGSHIEARFKLK